MHWTNADDSYNVQNTQCVSVFGLFMLAELLTTCSDVSSATVHITVEDENEFEPEFTEGAYQATARENHMHTSPPILQVGARTNKAFVAFDLQARASELMDNKLRLYTRTKIRVIDTIKFLSSYKENITFTMNTRTIYSADIHL